MRQPRIGSFHISYPALSTECGPTGVEMAGTLADMVKRTVPNEYRHVPYKNAQVFLIEAKPVGVGRVLSGFAALCSVNTHRTWSATPA